MPAKLELLGPVDLVRDDGTEIRSVLSQPQCLALLSYLTANRDAGFTRRTHLAEVFWSGRDESRSRNSLRQALFKITQSLAYDPFDRRGKKEIRVCKEAILLDVDELKRALACEDAEAALAVYRGPFMDGFRLDGARDFDDWLDAQRSTLLMATWSLAHSASLRALEEARPERALELAREATRLRPCNETSARTCIEIMAALGDVAAASDACDAFSHRLQSELDESPSQAFEDFACSIRSRAQPGSHAPASVQAANAPDTPGRDMSAPHAPPGDMAGPDAAPGEMPSRKVSSRDVPSREVPSRETTRRDSWSRVPVRAVSAVGVGLILVLAGIATAGAGPETAPAASDRQVIAIRTPVLLDPGEDRASIERGLHEELVTALAGLGLPLVPPTVVRIAERDTIAPPGSIARDLGARYELEATVRKGDGQYLVNATLVDWASGTTVWGERFHIDEVELLQLRRVVVAGLADFFDLKDDSSASGPADPEGAGQEFIAIRGLIHIAGSDRNRTRRWQDAELRLDRLLESNPDFADGWATLAFLKFRMFWLSADVTAQGLAKGERALERARALSPNGLETRLAEAYHVYHIQRDWERAADLGEEISGELEARTDVFLLWAMARRRHGDFEEAADILSARLERWPSEHEILGVELEATLRRLGRTAEADSIRSLRGPPSCGQTYGSALRSDVSLEELDDLATRCFSRSPRPFQAVHHEVRMRRPDAALRAIEEISADRAAAGHDPEWINQQWAPFPIDFWRAQALEVAGDAAAARRAWARHLPELERLASELPDDWLRKRWLSMAYTGARRENEAIASARATLIAAEAEGDVWAAVPNARANLMETYLAFGRTREATSILESLEFDTPVPFLSLAVLRSDPVFDGIRTDSDFLSILERLAVSQELPVLTIDGPTLVLFWTIPDSVTDPDALASLYAALDQQQTGMADAREALIGLGLAELQQPGRRFLLRGDGLNERFVAPADSAVVGYLFAAPNREVRVLYRVQFQDQLLAAAQAFVEGRPPPQY